jgi:TolA-binding protein
LGHAQYRKGDAEKAAATYGVLAQDASVQEPVRTLAILGQGYALVTLRRCQEAETTFGLLGSGSPLAQQEAFLAIGRCFELKGDQKAALNRYEDFAAKYPSSPLLSEPLKEKIQSMKETSE